MEFPTTIQRQEVNQAWSSSFDNNHDKTSDDENLPQAPTLALPVELPNVSASVNIRHCRLWSLMFVMIAGTVGLTILFHLGMELEQFYASDKSAEQQKQLLDDYNSYSGSIVSIAVTMIELVIGVVVQVVALHTLTRAFLRPNMNGNTALAVTLASAVIVYFVTNSFNALNVQTRDSTLEAVISNSDLSLVITTFDMDISNVTYSVGESTAQNSIANTVLKTLVLPRAAKSPPNCNWSLTTQNFRLYVPNDFVEVGFPQREWMTRLLPKALDASTLRFKLNATNTSTDVRNGELPMSASLAADLVVNAMFMSSEFIPWGKYKSWNDPVPTNITEAYPTSKSQKHRQVPTAELLELLPAGPEVSESAKKKWLLEAIEPVLSSKFADSDQFSLKDIGVEFAHIEVSPNITFDALTFELDVNTSLITNATNAADGTRYTLLSSSNCAPWPDRCLIPKAVMPPEGTVNYDLLYDAPAQVNAFAVCVNSDGSETIESTIFFNESDMIDYNMQSCSNSMSSILLISVSKRLVASALISDVTGDFDGLHSEAYSSVATNLRKIYSFTVSRLNWKIVDLAKEYKASCKVDGGNCFGLSIELNASNSTPDQRLVAGVEALPLNLLSAPLYSGKLHDEGQRPFTLIQVNEPPRQSILGDWYSIVAGDILLPHNVMLDRWELGQVDYSEQLCAHQEDRIELVLNNHYYMEHTLQATYTSALFFLMQNGVPTDTVPLDQKTTTLAFSANKQNIVVWISAPKLNAVLTYVGCLVLVVAIVTMLLIQNNGSLLGITAPHAIARVVLDGKTFPSFLLYRKVKFTSENAGGVYDVDNVVINTISVQPAKNASDLIEDSRTSNNSRDLRSV